MGKGFNQPSRFLTNEEAVLVHGPRQSGQTTLARVVAESMGYSYFTFDDDVQRAWAALEIDSSPYRFERAMGNLTAT